MTRYLLALLLALWATTAQAQFTLVGQDYEECATAAATCVFGTGVAANAGDLIVVLIADRDVGDISSVTDATNGAYTCPDGLDFTQASTVRSHGCYFINSGAATITPTVNWSTTGRGYGSFQVWRPTGTVTLDTTQESGAATNTSHSITSLSASANAQLTLCGYAVTNSGAPTAGAGYTLLTDNDSRWVGQYDITSVASGSFTCPITITNTSPAAGVQASFNDSGGGGGTPTRRLMTLGVGQ